MTCLFWAGNSVIGRALRDDVPPITLSFWRWSIAFVILLPWAGRPLVRQWRAVLANWKVMVFPGEALEPFHFVGAAVTFTGICLATAGTPRDAAAG